MYVSKSKNGDMNKINKQAHTHTYTHTRKLEIKKRKWLLFVTIQVLDFTETVFHHQCFAYSFQNSHDKTN